MGGGGGTIIGIVGYSAILDPYPLGPPLMTGLTEAVADRPDVRVENFTWSPVHVVQRFETGEMARPSRIVLIGSAAVSTEPGLVRAFRWTGGERDPLEVQERIYEAVTGIVDLENTLMIGAQFGVWPEETFTVEADLPSDTFGRMVMADNDGVSDDAGFEERIGFSPARQRQDLVRTAAALARHGRTAEISWLDKSADRLARVRPFTETHFAVASGGRT
ncbi:hypothetical protein [Ovoidimarina sediminis]|uniref:hypothetical protein n=1 Tax=Ovoidimarina sediminis TaxID=3079856 RepID=UPI00290CBEF2|nr:hypothetical protein [Rhodophyticola sp. MJ-SS7]MDU8944323.1 hypothetical protein [Rhodophyticola sp. MJ-SS7]